MRNWNCSRFARTAGVTLTLLIPTTAAAATAAADTQPRSTPRAGAASTAAPQASSQIDPDSLLLFSVELDRLTLTEGLAAYGDPQDPLIPFGELTRLLEYDVDVQPTERRIIGHLGEARTSLVIDIATATARVGGRDVALSASDVAITNTDIYLRASAIDRLLPLKLEVDSSDLNIKVKPAALLPVQSRLQRLARERTLQAASNQVEDEVLRVPSPYRLISPPSFDVTASIGASSGLSQGPSSVLRYDIRSGSDLLFGGLQGYVGSNEKGSPTVARFLLERRSAEGHLLGPLHARVLGFGDVFTPALSIGPRSISGRGVALSTVPLDETNIFNRIDLRGELPIGYDVELYVNDILQGGQNTPNKGRYEFLNVPLSRGINVIRIVTYGPHGERSEQTRIVNVGGGQLKRGEMTLEFGAAQQESPLLDLSDNNPSGTTTDFVSRGRGGVRAVASVNYGLTDLITLAGGAALIPETRTKSRGLATIGARTSLFGFLTQVDVGADSTGGAGASLGLAGQVFGVSTVGRYVRLQNGFIDENGPGLDFTRPLTSRAEVSFDGNAQAFGVVLPLSFRVSRTAYADGQVDVSGSARGSATVSAALLSAGFEYTRSRAPAGADSQVLTGFFAASSYRSFKWQIRSTVDYDILPQLKPRALAITVDRDISNRASLRLGIGENLERAEEFNLAASANFHTPRGDFAITSDYNNADQSWSLGAEVSFGALFDPNRKRYQFARPGPGSGGSVAFNAFYDKNGNGRRDPGETGVADVIVEGGGVRARTDSSGQALITGIGSGPSARVNVSLERVDAGSVKAPPQIIEIQPRPGQVTTVDYPIQLTSEVLVRILLARPDGTKVGLSGVILELVDAAGRSREAKTEFDGSASFSELTGGVYRLALDEEQAKRLRMHLVKPVTIAIKGDGGFTPDVSTEVRFDPRPEDGNSGNSAVDQ